MEQTLYEHDYYAWINTQVDLARSGRFGQLDWENMIEELGSMGRSERRAVENYLCNVVMHLLKGRYQPTLQSHSWRGSICHGRIRIQKLLKENPSLRPKLQEMLHEEYLDARLLALTETGLPEGIIPRENPFKLDEILDPAFFP